MQTILPLPNNQAVKLTTARYYTPSGRSIQAKGIVPDIVVDDAPDQRVLLREADLQHHLVTEDDKSAAADSVNKGKNPSDKVAGPAAIPAIPAAPATTAKATPPSKADIAPKDPNAKKEDLQLSAALNHLKGLPVNSAVTTTAAITK